MNTRLKLISPGYLDEYTRDSPIGWAEVANKLKVRANFSVEDFNYYIIASSLFSSKIEGNTLDLNSFMRHRGNKDSSMRKEVQEINDLVKAYQFGSENEISLPAFQKAHAILSKTLLNAPQRGKYRKNQVGVFDNNTGRPVYMAVEPQFVKQELAKLFGDIKTLLDRQLSYKETFYYASMIHLWIAMIHPFADGNGRAARLLEKWFLASRLGESAWSINTEKYYWDHRAEYYKNISLGYNYYSLFWERCLSFLLMLPKALKESLG